MSTASFVASQRSNHAIPCALACRTLEVPIPTLCARLNRPPGPARRCRAEIDAAVAESFETSGGTYGSPRVLADLRAAGWLVSKKTVEASIARQGLQGRRSRRHRPAPPDLLRRDFIADWADRGKWVGDFKQIHTAQGPVFLATVKDLFSSRLLQHDPGEPVRGCRHARPGGGTGARFSPLVGENRARDRTRRPDNANAKAQLAVRHPRPGSASAGKRRRGHPYLRALLRPIWKVSGKLP